MNLEHIQKYAISCHVDTNHKYDGLPYEVHLRMTVRIAKEYIHLIPSGYDEIVIASCWCHDLIEDCRQNYNDVRNKTCTTVADIVYALTNEKGKNRKERANDKYYSEIKNTELATFVKLCDRIANMEYSYVNNSDKLLMYLKENNHFINKLYDEKYKPMFDRIMSYKPIEAV